MNLNKTIAFIGAGNMAEALIRGLLAADTAVPRQIIATDVRPERLDELKRKLGIQTNPDNAAAILAAEVVILAVKPQQMRNVFANIRDRIGSNKLIISIAAGITTRVIESGIAPGVPVVRVMPNTPALVGQGAAALCKGAHATDADLAIATAILAAVGITVTVPEELMDAVTALSGSGPAYVFYVAEALIIAGRKAGLPAPIAKQLAIQTIKGAGQLLAGSSDSPEALRRKVTSPGGTTEAALRVLADHDMIAMFTQAIAAATKRGKELSVS